MKYIKLFENFEHEDWELLSMSPYELRELLISEIEQFGPNIAVLKEHGATE